MTREKGIEKEEEKTRKKGGKNFYFLWKKLNTFLLWRKGKTFLHWKNGKTFLLWKKEKHFYSEKNHSQVKKKGKTLLLCKKGKYSHCEKKGKTFLLWEKDKNILTVKKGEKERGEKIVTGEHLHCTKSVYQISFCFYNYLKTAKRLICSTNINFQIYVCAYRKVDFREFTLTRENAFSQVHCRILH